jgi:hypothetical protein
MPFEKGSPKKGGRKKGVKNKIPVSVKESVFETFIALQQDNKTSLFAWAKANQTEFYKLSAKLIPAAMEVKADIQINDITGVVILTPETKDK